MYKVPTDLSSLTKGLPSLIMVSPEQFIKHNHFEPALRPNHQRSVADPAVILCLNKVSFICLYLLMSHEVSHHILEHPFKQKSFIYRHLLKNDREQQQQQQHLYHKEIRSDTLILKLINKVLAAYSNING